ncbi:hypothetical protein [Salibacter halophilus]|uniref:Uncharacterized protein n=1 Tax=Salibacter halophilus TaxID=1803916 RepID=A0A6N6M247_9FLAO|nr:hypothetical protein [Salibacter halophilus]KAB1062838.1 hypothetical protein F3059_11670 [Salibacter halophilus]
MKKNIYLTLLLGLYLLSPFKLMATSPNQTKFKSSISDLKVRKFIRSTFNPNEYIIALSTHADLVPFCDDWENTQYSVIAKIDLNGDLIWSRTLDNHTVYEAIGENPTTGEIAVGANPSCKLPNNHHIGFPKIIKLSPDGTLLDSYTFTCPSDEFLEESGLYGYSRSSSQIPPPDEFDPAGKRRECGFTVYDLSFNENSSHWEIVGHFSYLSINDDEAPNDYAQAVTYTTPYILSLYNMDYTYNKFKLIENHYLKGTNQERTAGGTAIDVVSKLNKNTIVGCVGGYKVDEGKGFWVEIVSNTQMNHHNIYTSHGSASEASELIGIDIIDDYTYTSGGNRAVISPMQLNVSPGFVYPTDYGLNKRKIIDIEIHENFLYVLATEYLYGSFLKEVTLTKYKIKDLITGQKVFQFEAKQIIESECNTIELKDPHLGLNTLESITAGDLTINQDNILTYSFNTGKYEDNDLIQYYGEIQIQARSGESLYNPENCLINNNYTSIGINTLSAISFEYENSYESNLEREQVELWPSSLQNETNCCNEVIEINDTYYLCGGEDSFSPDFISSDILAVSYYSKFFEEYIYLDNESFDVSSFYLQSGNLSDLYYINTINQDGCITTYKVKVINSIKFDHPFTYCCPGPWYITVNSTLGGLSFTPNGSTQGTPYIVSFNYNQDGTRTFEIGINGSCSPNDSYTATYTTNVYDDNGDFQCKLENSIQLNLSSCKGEATSSSGIEGIQPPHNKDEVSYIRIVDMLGRVAYSGNNLTNPEIKNILEANTIYLIQKFDKNNQLIDNEKVLYIN